MGQVIQCDGCQAEPATLLITNTDNGDVLAFGVPCAVVWAQGFLGVMRQELPELFTDEQPGESAESDGPGPADSQGEDVPELGTPEGGGHDGAVRDGSGGAEGVPARRAGATESDDAGQDRPGQRGRSGSGRAGRSKAQRAGEPELTAVPPS